jgi:hypothetical protein
MNASEMNSKANKWSDLQALANEAAQKGETVQSKEYLAKSV